jgi:hypothetical protein
LATEQPYRYQEQLLRDLGSGKAIPYRRLPGLPGSSEKRYINPLTGQTTFDDGSYITEDYVLRHYRPALAEAERQATTQANRRYAFQSRGLRISFAETFLLKKQVENPLMSDEQLRDNFNQEFMDLYAELKRVQIAARNTDINSPLRAGLMAPDGPYAELLVALGRREPDASWAVGLSKEQVTGVPTGEYINEVVIPYYRSLLP